MKKLFSLLSLITILIFCTSCAGNHPTARKKVKITLKVPTLEVNCLTAPDIHEAYDFLKIVTADFAAQYKDAEVTFNIVKFPLTEENAYVPDCFGTENATDILYEDFFNMSTYLHTGRVIPLDDIIDSAWREDINPNYWTLGQAEERTYMLPYLARQNVLAYNKALFRQAGLEKFISHDDAIQSWTLNEWNEIMAQLAQNLPANTYAISMYARNEQGDTHTMTWLRSHGSSFFDTKGNVHLNTPEGIAALRWLKDNYDKGYYPPNCENIAIKDCGRLFWNNQLAVKMNNVQNLNYDDNNIGLVNFPSLDGKGMVTSFVTGFAIFDNGDPAKIKVAKDFLKFFYHTDKYLDYSAGNLPASRKVTKKYQNQIYRRQAFENNSDKVINFMHNSPNWRGVRSVFYKHIQDLFLGINTPEEVAAALDAECNTAIELGRKHSKLHK